MNNNYLLESTDYLSIQNEIAEIVKKTSFQDSAISIYDLEETLKRLKVEELYNQVLFHTEKSLRYLKYNKSEGQ